MRIGQEELKRTLENIIVTYLSVATTSRREIEHPQKTTQGQIKTLLEKHSPGYCVAEKSLECLCQKLLEKCHPELAIESSSQGDVSSGGLHQETRKREFALGFITKMAVGYTNYLGY